MKSYIKERSSLIPDLDSIVTHSIQNEPKIPNGDFLIMRIALFGATGMVGGGVLKECLDDKRVEKVLVLGRQKCGEAHDKLHEILHNDFFDYNAIMEQLAGYDACFFCLGVSVLGKDEITYNRLTYDLTVAAADALLKANPATTFIYVSAAGADSTEQGRSMWARVRGRLENKLLQMPFKATYIFRPSYIQPMRGTKSRVILYRILYALIGWAYPLLQFLFPRSVTSTVAIGQAMINLVDSKQESHILGIHAINLASHN
jgi:uncharacterized protein YbjT (DUF2867 family)